MSRNRMKSFKKTIGVDFRVRPRYKRCAVALPRKRRLRARLYRAAPEGTPATTQQTQRDTQATIVTARFAARFGGAS